MKVEAIYSLLHDYADARYKVMQEHSGDFHGDLEKIVQDVQDRCEAIGIAYDDSILPEQVREDLEAARQYRMDWMT